MTLKFWSSVGGVFKITTSCGLTGGHQTSEGIFRFYFQVMSWTWRQNLTPKRIHLLSNKLFWVDWLRLPRLYSTYFLLSRVPTKNDLPQIARNEDMALYYLYNSIVNAFVVSLVEPIDGRVIMNSKLVWNINATDVSLGFVVRSALSNWDWVVRLRSRTYYHLTNRESCPCNIRDI